MEMDEKILQAIQNTYVLRPPKQRLSTFGSTNVYYYMITELMQEVNVVSFGSTNVYYYMITELMQEVNVVREGRVIAARPKIVTPHYLVNAEGFSGSARRYIQMMAEQNPYEPGVLYSYKNETTETNIISQSLADIVDKINQRIDSQDNPLSAVIKGVEELWDVSLMKFTFELTRNSLQQNISEFYASGRLSYNAQGVPRDAIENIEELFDIVRQDPSHAPELVSELQRWGLWSQYQDRFLQLFRKH